VLDQGREQHPTTLALEEQLGLHAEQRVGAQHGMVSGALAHRPAEHATPVRRRAEPNAE
jgi:hypothetical protein